MAELMKENKESDFRGNVMKRLLLYMKPYWMYVAVSFLFVLLLTGLELYRPIIVGNAIDRYISGYGTPYGVVNEREKGAVPYHGTYYSKTFTETEETRYLQIMLYQDQYYAFEEILKPQQEALKKWEADGEGMVKAEKNMLSIQFPNGEIQKGMLLSADELQILRNTDFHGVMFAGFLYIAVLLLTFILNASHTWMLQWTGQKIIYDMRKELFSHIHSLSLRFFDRMPIGKLVTRITNDVEALNEMYSGILVKLFRNILKIIGLALVMLFMNFKMACYSFLLLPFIMILTYIFRKISRSVYRIARTRLTDLNTFLSENISGMKVIQIFAREKEKYEEFENKNHSLYRAFFKEMMVFAVFRPLIYLLSVLALSIVIGLGASSVLEHVISIGTLFIFIQYIGSFFEPIQELAEQFGTLQSSLASAEKIFTILDEESMVGEDQNPILLPEVKGKIEFRNVWFAYEKEDYVLRDVSFVIEPGEKAAFVGATGAGKSSILNLIGRYYEIQKGQILMDGVDIKRLKKDQLRRAIGQVQQDVFIFTGDIKSNIRLKNEDITLEQIKDAANRVNASDFIERLPNGYDEPVTERGATLSSGQRQLLSFARTLAYHPKILVMDEATANIDTETELLIQDALETLMKGRTTIMVAHRLSTIQHADKIMVMHKGKIREIGTHQKLLQHDGLYRKLYDLQLHTI